MTSPTPPTPPTFAASDAAHTANAFAGFGKFVPGFDFLQNLAAQTAASAAQSQHAAPPVPGLGSWIAPTLNVDELERRIKELKTVQFWLDQNATALKATITALEVQKMTLSTLKDMNFSMTEVANAFKVPGMAEADAPPPPDKGKISAGLEIPPTVFGAAAQPAPPAAPDVAAAAPAAPASPAKSPAGADPMQWWGALTQQFQTIAAEALKDVAQKAAAAPLLPTADASVGGTTDGAAAQVASLAEQAAGTLAASREVLAESTRKTVAGGAALITKTFSQAAWPMPGAASAAKKPASKSTGKSIGKSTVKSAAKSTNKSPAKPAKPAKSAKPAQPTAQAITPQTGRAAVKKGPTKAPVKRPVTSASKTSTPRKAPR